MDRPPTVISKVSGMNAICHLSEAAAHRQLTGDMEGHLSRYFFDKYFALLLLPNCHPDFYNGWISEIRQFMVGEKSLRYSALANAASHLHFVDSSSPMQELALTYYSNSLRGLSKLLAQGCPLENHDGLLMSVIFLYLHGVSISILHVCMRMSKNISC